MIFRQKIFFPLFFSPALLLPAAPGFCSGAAGGYQKTLCEDIKKPFFSPSGRAAGIVTYKPGRPGAAAARNNSFVMPKPGGTKRVFVIGESNAALLARPCPGGDRDCLSLLAGYYGYKAEILNCGMPGYDADRTFAVMKEIMQYSPDAVVALVGNSEGADLSVCPGFWQKLKGRGYMAVNFLRWRLPPAEVAKKFLLDEQAAVFRRMARLAAGKKVPLVFCTLPGNLSDFPPMGDLPLEDRLFASGWDAYVKGDHAAARAAFSGYAEKRPKDPLGRYYLGQALMKMGEPAAARGAFRSAAELDLYNDNCSISCNSVIRRAASGPALFLADLEEKFRLAAPSGVPGGAMFDDRTHWSREYDALAACAVMDRLLEAFGRSPSAAGGLPLSSCVSAVNALTLKSARPDKWPAKTAVLARYLVFYMNMLNGWNGFKERLAEVPTVFLQRLLRLDRRFLIRISESPEAMYAAVTFPGDAGADAAPLENIRLFWPHYLAHLGEALSREGEIELARKYFTRSLAWAPEYESAYLHRGILRLKAGDKKGALSDFARSPAVSLRIYNIAKLNGLAEALKELRPDYGGDGDTEDGNRYFVYGGEAPLSGAAGFHPEEHGYALLGSAPEGTTMFFPGRSRFYAIVVHDTAVLKVDALRFSGGAYCRGSFSDGNVKDHQAANGAPDGKAAVLGGKGGYREGYLIAAAEPGSRGIKVFALP